MQTVDLGYAITSACLATNECDKIANALSAGAVARSRAGARHLMANPIVAALANSDRLIELAEEWVGGMAVPFRATLFEKSRRTNWLIPWHQDTALPLTTRFERKGWGPWSEKAGATYAHAPDWALSRVVALRVHLDDSNADNGALRVIPGSHIQGVLTDQGVLRYVSTHAEVACLTQRGGVIAMRPLLIHSSSKVQSIEPRQVLHIEYADSLNLGDDIQLAVV
ncbi:MAG: protein involved in biosynthesis of mitomycin antibiotics/polyketide fumonisin [Bryobacterales bacterium]|nr:protein involved in biosynthesis of mitomycin antibiotics/polyketide fumonisin [Bryobacterales bacterium]